MSASYRWLTARFHPPLLSCLPNTGKWVSVEEASQKFGVSSQLVRLRYLNKELPAIYFKKEERILVDIQGIKSLKKKKIKKN